MSSMVFNIFSISSELVWILSIASIRLCIWLLHRETASPAWWVWLRTSSASLAVWLTSLDMTFIRSASCCTELACSAVPSLSVWALADSWLLAADTWLAEWLTWCIMVFSCIFICRMASRIS